MLQRPTSLAPSSSVSPASKIAWAFLRSTSAQAISHGPRVLQIFGWIEPAPRLDLLEHGPGRVGIDQGHRDRGLGAEPRQTVAGEPPRVAAEAGLPSPA